MYLCNESVAGQKSESNSVFYAISTRICTSHCVLVQEHIIWAEDSESLRLDHGQSVIIQ